MEKSVSLRSVWVRGCVCLEISFSVGVWSASSPAVCARRIPTRSDLVYHRMLSVDIPHTFQHSAHPLTSRTKGKYETRQRHISRPCGAVYQSRITSNWKFISKRERRLIFGLQFARCALRVWRRRQEKHSTQSVHETRRSRNRRSSRVRIVVIQFPGPTGAHTRPRHSHALSHTRQLLGAARCSAKCLQK